MSAMFETAVPVGLPRAAWAYVPQGPSTWRELREWVKEDYAAHGRDLTSPGFRAVAIHRFGNFRMQRRSRIVRLLLGRLYWPCFRYVRNIYGIELPYSARLGRRVVIEHQGSIVVHGNSVIGDECILRQNVTLGIRRIEDVSAAPILCRGVDVGAGAAILGNVRIGEYAKIGANSVVLSNVPDRATAVGNPASIASANLDPARRLTAIRN